MKKDLKPPHTGYSLWFMASKKDQQLLQDMVDTLAKKYRTEPFVAHMTLIGLGDWSHAKLSQLKKGAAKLAQQGKPFKAEIVGTASRNMHFQCVFLPVVPDEPATTLNQQARKIFKHQNDPQYFPHFSSVYGDLPPATKKKIIADINKKYTFPLSVQINEISLVDSIGYPEEWHAVERYKLGR